MSLRTAILLAIGLAVIHLVLACVYASLTPYRTAGILLGQRDPATGQFQSVPDVGAPDERQHVNYTIHLQQGNGFPVLNPEDPKLAENYQAHQPPLFYILHAGWTRLTGADLTNSASGLAARSLNALIGAATVLGAFFLGLWALRRSDVGLVAASFVALLPMNTALSGAVSNDPLLFCLCTWALALMAKGCTLGWTMKLAIGLGLVVGAAILTKTTAIALLPCLLVAVWLSEVRPTATQIVACSLLVALVSGPWLARNHLTYGDPLALTAFNDAFKNSPSRELMTQVATVQNPDKDPNLAYWMDWVGWWTARSFYGVFGYMDVFLNERGTPSTGRMSPNSLYRMLLALGALAVALWALALQRGEWKEHRRMHWLLGIFLLVIVVLFVRFNMQYFQGQARYLFPAIAVFGVGLGVGTINVSRGRLMPALATVILILGALNAYALIRLPGEFAKRVQATILTP